MKDNDPDDRIAVIDAKQRLYKEYVFWLVMKEEREEETEAYLDLAVKYGEKALYNQPTPCNRKILGEAYLEKAIYYYIWQRVEANEMQTAAQTVSEKYMKRTQEFLKPLVDQKIFDAYHDYALLDYMIRSSAFAADVSNMEKQKNELEKKLTDMHKVIDSYQYKVL